MEKKIFENYEISMLTEIVEEQIENIENHSISYGTEEDNKDAINDWRKILNKIQNL
ncbi:MAG: hypothetical protein J1F35_05690 [Erysipelotrichales bacterium]|nr:hypothetical protein [Erysipelotrichales bacterium]